MDLCTRLGSGMPVGIQIEGYGFCFIPYSSLYLNCDTMARRLILDIMLCAGYSVHCSGLSILVQLYSWH